MTGVNAPGIAGMTLGNGFALVLGTDGSVWAWGADGYGQLGNAPAQVAVTRPVRTIGPGSGITQVSAGEDHVLAVRSNGTVLDWGDNANGALGDGSRASAFGPVQVIGLTDASQVSAGWEFSLAVYEPPSVAVP